MVRRIVQIVDALSKEDEVGRLSSGARRPGYRNCRKLVAAIDCGKESFAIFKIVEAHQTVASHQIRDERASAVIGGQSGDVEQSCSPAGERSDRDNSTNVFPRLNLPTADSLK